MQSENDTKNGKAKAIIAADPARSFPIGGQLNFSSLLFPYTPSQQSASVRDWEYTDGVILAITFSEPQHHTIEGSAVMVGPGIAMCAWHVIEPRIQKIASGEHGITCFGVTEGGLHVWRVKKITAVPNSDLAILGLELANDLQPNATLYKSAITTRLPKVGDRLTIFGFRAGQEIFERNADSAVEFSANLLVSSGAVITRYLTGRDQVMIRWPALEVSCPSWGGMSGGPVFNSEGKVIGLLSSSFSTSENDGPSYVSLLLPGLVARFEGGWPAGLFNNASSLLDLNPALCSIEGREAIVVKRNAATGIDDISFRFLE